MIAVVLTVILALGLSAIFSAGEISIFALSDARIRTLVGEGFRGSKALERVRSRPERLLVLLRLGTVVADALVAGSLAYLGLLAAGGAGALVGIGFAILLILLLGDLVPMRLALGSGVRIALTLAPPLELAGRALAPVLAVLAQLGQVSHGGATGAVSASTERQVRELTALGHTEGIIEEQERQLIERVFRLDETRIWDIMTPRVDIFAWDESQALSQIASGLGRVSYSRVPVYRETIDNVTGVLYVRDAYQALLAGQRDVRLKQLAREPLIVPGSLPLTTLLRDFQTRRIHLAIVVDEYGGTDGLVTLEDVLEELVGEIVDETDVAYEPMVRVSRHEVLAAGDADLREINHFFNTALPHLEHRSLNGYLLEEFGRVPEAGERLEREGLDFEVLDASETQVLKARVRRRSPEAPRPGEARGTAEAAAGTGRTAAAASGRDGETDGAGGGHGDDHGDAALDEARNGAADRVAHGARGITAREPHD
jgi:magnesium and cobalt exporter, CNNM family